MLSILPLEKLFYFSLYTFVPFVAPNFIILPLLNPQAPCAEVIHSTF